ncbi:polysaccharide biosynthesis tyrosine autokinase [Caproiciproducens faecalis]|uniref:non-specific protein-tyrosine kinase n=1 Tax=Caproiciproducens faecalis TaxID=2820301 RepID=A0ABS7DQ31_9FIRM|nr:polysaccharide biosynthesis tyrosine autokinase [Caproiciproducens faecalis]MBW7573400.1 AAA family ATPase [Caproiciproducens faecalis]
MELFVSFSEILEYFKRSILKFIIVVAVFGIVFGLMPLKFVQHEYTCDTTLIISCEVPEDAQTDYRLQYTSILNSRVQTAVVIATGKDMISQTADKLGIDKSKITSIGAVQVNTAPVVKITIKSPDAALADRIANTAAEVLGEKLTDAFPSPKLTAVIADAAIPAKPQSNKSAMVKAGLLGLIMGFIVYVCYGIVVVLTDKTIRNSRYVSEALNTPLLGTVPKKGSHEKKEDSFRKLRAAAVHCASGKNSFLVTDVCEHNGAAAVAAGMAGVLACSGKTTLLIDADFRENEISKLLNAKSEHSLTDALNGSCSAEQAVAQTSVKGLNLISGSGSAENPADLLFSDTFSGLVQELSKKFDYVIVHTPSEVKYPEADNIARLAGSVIMVAKYGSTPYHEFKDSFHRLNASGGNTIGFVTTDI